MSAAAGATGSVVQSSVSLLVDRAACPASVWLWPGAGPESVESITQQHFTFDLCILGVL